VGRGFDKDKPAIYFRCEMIRANGAQSNEGAMSEGFQVQMFIQMVDREGEPFGLRRWNMVADEMRRTSGALEQSKGPWISERGWGFQCRTWIVRNEAQVKALSAVAHRVQEILGVEVVFNYQRTTFEVFAPL